MILLLEILFLIVCVVYVYFKYSFTYWKRKGVPYIEPGIFGNLKDSFTGRRAIGETIHDIYSTMKAKGHKHVGIYFITKPMYMPMDPKLIKAILVKDFPYFTNRLFYNNEKSDPLSAHLFSLDGERWKNLRTKLSPTFTSGKLKKMFQTLVDCSLELGSCLNEMVRKDEPVDIKTICAKYTTDVIGSCAFGIDCNSFKDPNTEFVRVGKKAFVQSFVTRMKFFLVLFWPKAGPLFRIRVTDNEVHNFFINLVADTVEYREKNHINRNDFLQLLIDLKNKRLQNEEHSDEVQSPVGTTLTVNEMAAQAFLFFVAGFETSSTLMTYFLYEIAHHPDIQDKLRQEIVSVLLKHNGHLSYEALGEMSYLDQTVSETLRKYPPAPFLRRATTKEYKLPDSDITLDKDCVVTISVLGLQRDPEYYPNPDLFDPDRFSPENKSKIPEFTYLPFGDGPRNCIGLRFGLLQSKVGLCQLIKNYKFSINSKTVKQIVIEPSTGLLIPRDTIWLSAKRVTE